MSIELNKKTGINLSKGTSISLMKDEKKLEQICVGINWGAIQKKSFFGLVKETQSVDLDGSVSTFNASNEVVDTVYYRHLLSQDRAIRHSGDDLRGDTSKADDLDNEVLEVNLKLIDPAINQIVFYINSYNGQDFATIPYSKIRIFEGNSKQVQAVFATFNLSAEGNFGGKIAMVMGKLLREENKSWRFVTIGEAISARDIGETISIIQKNYL